MSLPRSWHRLAWRAALSNVKRLSFPYKLTFAVTDRCNARCEICRVWRREPRPELTAGEISRFFARSNGFSWIDLTGGEVVLREDLPEIVAGILAACRGLSILHFPTNGQLPDRTVDVAERILALRPPSLIVTVSLDGPPEVHDSLRGIPGAYDRALETFVRLRALAGARVFLGMTVSALNAPLLRETAASVAARVPGFSTRELHLNLVQFSDHGYGNLDERGRATLSPAAGPWAEALRLAPARGPKDLLQRAYLRRIPEYLATGRMSVPCQALAATCFMDPSGVVHPCSMHGRPLGSVRESGWDLGRIWDAPAAVRARRDLTEGRCPGCWSPCEAYPGILGSALRCLVPWPPATGPSAGGAPGRRMPGVTEGGRGSA